MSELTRRRRLATSSIWKMVESFLSKGISTIISIVLARILMPSDYGLVAISGIFMNFAAILIQGGINTALIRKKEVDNKDYSVAFFFSLFIAFLLYGLFYFSAPFIADYYSEPLLISVLRVQFIGLFFYALAVVQNTIVVREYRFRELCVASLVANLAGGVLGIVMAYRNYGVWALVWYSLVRDFLANFLLFGIVRWKPSLFFSIKRLYEIIRVSSWLLFGTVLDFFANNIFNTVFGKKYTKEDLAFYSKGAQLPELICLHTFGAVTSVLLPTLAENQDDALRMKMILRKLVALSSFIIFPMMGGLAIVGERLVTFLFTEKWLPCVPILWAVSLNFSINILRQLNMQVIVAKGKSKISFLADVVRSVILIISVVVGIVVFHYDIYMIAFNSIFVTIVVVVFTQGYCKKLIGYSFKEWLTDLFPAISLTVLMGLGVLLFEHVVESNNEVFMLLSQVMFGVIIYIALARVFKVSSYKEMQDIILELLKRKKK